MRIERTQARLGLALAVLLLSRAAVVASGWERDWQGGKAGALGGAFVAQADDATAAHYNPAGLAFLAERQFAAGFETRVDTRAGFRGFDPIPGDGTRGERSFDAQPAPHVYWAEPLAARWSLGVAFNQPYALDSRYADPEQWVGRFQSQEAELTGWTLSPSVVFRAHRTLGLSLGLVGTVSKFRWERHEQELNPATQLLHEIGSSSLRAGAAIGIGLTAGLLYRPNARWSWGARWRSAVAADYRGRAEFVQLPSGDSGFDMLAAGLRPFGEDVRWEARVEQPAYAVIGVGVALSPTILLEFDLERTRWQPVNATRIRFFDHAGLERVPFAGWGAGNGVRAGLRWDGLGNGEWRAGLFLIETPQPASDVGPLVADGTRRGVAIGYGARVFSRHVDLALLLEERGPRVTRDNRDGFNGRYTAQFLQMVLTFRW